MNAYVWGLTLFVTLGGFMFGYDTGVINGVKDMPGFRTTVGLSNGTSNGSTICSESTEEVVKLGVIVSVFSIGCLAGALTAGVISDWLGRKPTIMAGSAVFTIGGAVQGATFQLWMILLGRFIAGLGIGVLSMVVPIYNAEVAPKNLRGRLVSLQQLSITAGVMVSFLVNLVCERFLVGWRVALSAQVILGVVLFVGMAFLPETPRWLVGRGKEVKAECVLARLRQSSQEGVREELSEISTAVEESRTSEGSLRSKLRALASWRIVQRIVLGMLLQLFQQLTGMNVIMYYSTSIVNNIGGSGYVATAIFGIINFLTTIITIFLIDKVGRKILLLLGGVGMFISMATAAILLLLYDVQAGGEKAVGYVVIVLIGVFVFNFAYSWGPVAWVVTSEIFPLEVRGYAVSMTTSANWIGNFFVSFAPPILICSRLQTFGTFFLFSGFLLVSIVFVLLTLPETKGESLEKIDKLFSKSWLERIDLFYYLRCGYPWSSGPRSRGPRSRGHYRPASVSDIAHSVSRADVDEETDTSELLPSEKK